MVGVVAEPGSEIPHSLLRMPLAERDRILARAAAEAEVEYRTNPELTDFEAMDEDELYDGTEAKQG